MRLAAIATVLLLSSVIVRGATQQTELNLAAFVGAWKEDVAKRQSGRSSGLTYTFTQDVDGFVTIVRAGVDLRDRVRFDGKDYETAGVPGRTVSWTKISDTEYDTTIKRNGVLAARARWIISDSGKRLTQQTTPTRVDDKSVTNATEYIRIVGAGNSLIGEWRPIAASSPDADAFVITLIDDVALKVVYPRNNGSYTMRPDGKEYIAENPNALPDMTTLAETLGSRSLRRSTLRSHKPIFEIVMTVSSDGKTLTVSNRTIGVAETAVHVYDKQY
jgi:hypothetical protein